MPRSRTEHELLTTKLHLLAKDETPTALIQIAVLVAVLSGLNFLAQPLYYPVFHVIDLLAVLVLLSAGLWLRRPAVPPGAAPWTFAAGMLVLVVSLLVQAWFAPQAGLGYVLIVVCLTGPLVLAWRPFLLVSAAMVAATAFVALGSANPAVVDWTLLCASAAAASGVIMQLRLRSIRADIRAEQALAEQTQRLELVLDSSRLGLWDWNMQTGDVVLDDRWAEMLGYRLDELEPITIDIGNRLTHPDDLVVSDALIEEHKSGAAPFYELELRMRHRDGHWVWVRDRGQIVEWTPDGQPLRMTGTHEDVSAAHKAAEELMVLAMHDALTGLANRVTMIDEVARAITSARRSGRWAAVLMIDLDRFKYVNDTFGHGVGDTLLVTAAQRIQMSVRASDVVARPGGDEFVIVMRDLEEPSEAARVAWRIVDSFRRPIVIRDAEFYTTASIGIAIATDTSDADDLIREADTAMYVAKEQGRDRVSTFNEELRAAMATRLEIEGDLRHALERGQLVVWYQPEIDLSSGDVIAVEALLRWHHPDGRLLTADAFVGVAEETSLILDIGDWVLHEACVQAAAWAAERPDRPLTVRVNLSALQLVEAGLLPALDSALAMSGVDPALLCVEITETALLRQTALAHDNIMGIRERGITIALDDFGTGYASLTYLRQYPINIIKIDRSFVTHLTDLSQDHRIVGGIIALAEALGMSVTAEGVENEAQADLLLAMGCPGAQGFLFSQAVPPSDIGEMIQRTCFSGRGVRESQAR
jgi:diguanylate cyclase (GGDEF)-like protein/PAS domain S-box-containing protein